MPMRFHIVIFLFVCLMHYLIAVGAQVQYLRRRSSLQAVAEYETQQVDLAQEQDRVAAAGQKDLVPAAAIHSGLEPCS